MSVKCRLTLRILLFFHHQPSDTAVKGLLNGISNIMLFTMEIKKTTHRGKQKNFIKANRRENKEGNNF